VTFLLGRCHSFAGLRAHCALSLAGGSRGRAADEVSSLRQASDLRVEFIHNLICIHGADYIGRIAPSSRTADRRSHFLDHVRQFECTHNEFGKSHFLSISNGVSLRCTTFVAIWRRDRERWSPITPSAWSQHRADPLDLERVPMRSFLLVLIGAFAIRSGRTLVDAVWRSRGLGKRF
jgi:hypothetical protein